MSEIFFPVYKDTFYTTSSPTLNYSISTTEDGVIFRGFARRGSAPSIKINIAKIANDYLENKFSDAASALTGDDGIWVHRDAFKYFYLYDGLGNLLATYGALFDFDGNFAGESRILSDPIKPGISASQRIPLTVYNPYPAEIDVGSDYFQLLTPSLLFSYTGETKSLIWNTNIPVETLSVLIDNTGYTVSNLTQNGCDITIGPNETLNAITGTASIYSGGTELLGTASLLQPADPGQFYFTIEMISGGTLNYGLDGEDLYYRKNGGEWVSVPSSPTASTISTTDGDIIEFKGWLENSYNRIYSLDGKYKAYGNVHSLVFGDNFRTLTDFDYGRRRILTGFLTSPTGTTNGLIDARDMVFPAASGGSYDSMFSGCTNLCSAPAVLSAASAMTYCDMFIGCTSLTEPPLLPAGLLSGNCYESMFEDCTSLKYAPALEAVTVSNGCYRRMFKGCTTLTAVPEIKAKNLSGNTFESMFEDCTSLITIPDQFSNCTGDTGAAFKYMFKGCTALYNADIHLTPNTNWETFEGMFSGCTSLLVTPILDPDSNLFVRACAYMFAGCTSLRQASFSQIPSKNIQGEACGYMFKDCTSLVTAPELPATSVTYGVYQGMFENCTSLTVAPALPFTLVSAGACAFMFKGCTSLVTGPQTLPATANGYKTNIYREMFAGCTSLVTGPTEIGLQILDEYACYGMFSGCTSLTTTALFTHKNFKQPKAQSSNYDYGNYSCAYMYDGCTSITEAPVPMIVYNTTVYEGMFRGCTSITEAPKNYKDAGTRTGLRQGAPYMFSGCTSLQTLTYCQGYGEYTDWVAGVPDGGEFYLSDGTQSSWHYGNNGIPQYWTKKVWSPPVLS